MGSSIWNSYRKKLGVTGLLILLIAIRVVAQFAAPTNYKFKTYTTQDGLADNTITKMVKDKRGFLWIATHNGISRFDGQHFKTYTHIPSDSTSLRSIWITDMLVDSSQTLWVSTEGGLCYYDEKFDRFRYVNTAGELQLIYKAPMCKGADNSLWVAAENGLKKIDSRTKKIQATSLNRIPDPQAIIIDRNDNILIGTRGFGIYCYHIPTGTIKKMQLGCIGPDAHIMSFFMDDDGLWAATSYGLVLMEDENHSQLYNSGAGSLAGQLFEQLMCINVFKPITGKGQLLCGTYDKKLLLFDKSAKKFIYRWDNELSNPEHVPAGVFYCLYPEEKTFWAGTDYGLCKLSLTEQDFITTLLPTVMDSRSSSLLKKIIPASTNKNQYWIAAGPPDNGVLLYDMTEKKIVKKISTGTQGPDKIYITLHAGPAGEIYALTNTALDIISTSGTLVKSYQLMRPCFDIDLDNAGNAWIGTATGIISLNTINGKQELYDCNFKGTEVENSSFSETFRAAGIRCNNDSLVWLVSIKYGLFAFNKNTKAFTPYRQPFTGTYNTLNRSSGLVIDGGDIWTANMAGISCYHPVTGSFSNYNASNGLQSTYVYSLGKDSAGYLWGRGNAGIFSFNPQTKRFINYTLPLAFLGSLINQSISTLNNGVAVGFEGGFVLFSPQKQAEDLLPKAIITDCRVGNDHFYFDKDSIAVQPVSFSYHENSIQFRFTAISFNHPQNTTLFYMLQGLDGRWIPADGNDMVSYNNLSEGSYEFKVQATGLNDRQHTVPAVFRFTVFPPYWRTWWFRLLAGVFISCCIIFIFRYRVKMIKRKEAQKTATNKTVAELEMKTLRSRMNPHFIFNSLNSIQKFIWENKKDDASDYLSKFAKLMRLILDHSAQTYITLSEELDALKLYMELEHRRCNGKFDYSITIDPAVDAAATKIPPLILQPFVENAIWHGISPLQNKIGLLTVSIKKQDHELVCEVRDNGIGRVKAAELKAGSSISKSSVGLDITRQRLEQMNIETRLDQLIIIKDLYKNDEADGTLVSVHIPEVKD